MKKIVFALLLFSMLAMFLVSAKDPGSDKIDQPKTSPTTTYYDRIDLPCFPFTGKEYTKCTAGGRQLCSPQSC